MAYKFQLGEAKLSGSITQTDGTITALGLDNSNANATNFGSIEADSIVVADAASGLDIDGSGANSGFFSITMGDNLATALDIAEGSNSYLKFTTTNSSELIESYQNLRMNSSKAVQFGNADTKIGSDGSGGMQLEVSGAANDLVLVHGVARNFSVKDGLNEAEVNIRMSGSGLVEFGANTESIGLKSDFSALEIKADSNIELSSSADVDIILHDGTNGLKLAGTLVTANASEINVLDGATNANNTAGKAVILDGSGDLTLAGNLTVQGTTTTIESTTLTVADTVITIADGDTSFQTGRGFELGDGTDALGNFKTATETLDGGSKNIFKSSLSISASAFYATEFVGDGGKLTGVAATELTETVQTFSAAGNVSSSAGTIVLAQSASSAYTLTLEPAADSDGKVIKIKREDGANVTITAPENIDDTSSLVLESEYAAVSLFSNGTQYYIV